MCFVAAGKTGPADSAEVDHAFFKSKERVVLARADIAAREHFVAAGAAPAPASAKVVSAEEGQFVASKAGTKYYLPSCAGASNIKEENRVYFVSVAQAQAAGYTAAANCPGI